MLPETFIEWDRGVTSKMHKKTGIWINMYKDNPGIFYDMRGGVIPASLAGECGFDINKLQKAAQRKKEVAAVMNEMDHKYSNANEQEVLFARGDYKVVSAGKGFADVYDIDGNHWNTVKIKAKEAIDIVKKLTDEKEPEEQTA